MKFGNRLDSVIGMYDAEWNLFWIDYSGLKNLLSVDSDSKSFNDVVTDNPTTKELKQLVSDPREVRFFKKVGVEIRKVSEFYQIVEGQFLIRLQRIRWSLGVVTSVNDDSMNSINLERLLVACNKLHRDLLMLESYCLMNYSGFSKILKKHDKLTGYATRDIFMRSKVNKQPFVKPRALLDMISESELIFHQVTQLYETSQSRTLEHDDIVETMLSLKPNNDDDDDNDINKESESEINVFDECLKATRREA